MSIFLFAGVALVVGLVLRRTRFGYHVYAVGGDEQVSVLSGLRTHRVVIAAHVICSVCAALTGLFLASRLGSGTPRVGTDGGYDLESIAAVVLGGTALAGGRAGWRAPSARCSCSPCSTTSSTSSSSTRSSSRRCAAWSSSPRWRCTPCAAADRPQVATGTAAA